MQERKYTLRHVALKQLLKRAPVLICVVIVVGMLIFFNSNRTLVYNELMALDLIPKPETLTELYFVDGAKLPASATKGQEISFSFVIHNLESQNYQYDINVFVKHGDKNINIDNGSVTVKDGQYYIKDEKFKFNNSSGSQEVIVELTNKKQSIDFWINNNS